MPILKNPGPPLSSKTLGAADSLSPEWRTRLGLAQLDQEQPTDVEPSPLSALIVQSQVVQTRTDERKKTDISLVLSPAAISLLSQERLPTGQVATFERKIVDEGVPLALTDTVIRANQRNTGLGKLEQEILSAPLPGPSVIDSSFDQVGALVRVQKTRKLVSGITEGESFLGGVRVRTTRDGETATVADELIETESVPGPTIRANRFESDGHLVSIQRTKKQFSLIVPTEIILGNIWRKVSVEFDTAGTAYEVVEERTIPGPAIGETRIDDRGARVQVQRTRKARSLITEGESFVGNTRFRTTREDETLLVSREIVETEPVPGPITKAVRFEPDGSMVTVLRTKKRVELIVPAESVFGNVWRRVSIEFDTDKTAYEVVEERVLPGPTLLDSRFDQLGVRVQTQKTLKLTSQIVEGETFVGNTRTRTTREGKTALLSEEIVEAEPVPGTLVRAVRFESDGIMTTIQRTKKQFSLIVPSETIVGNVWRRVSVDFDTERTSFEVIEERTIPGPTLTTARFIETGALVLTQKQRKQISQIIVGETFVGNTRVRTTREDETALIATQIAETEPVPGPISRGSRFEPDGIMVLIQRTKKRPVNITTAEVVTGNVWRKTYIDFDTEGTAFEVIEERTIPGPQSLTTRVDPDGFIVSIFRRRRATGDIVDEETLINNIWKRTSREGENGLIATEVIEQRSVVGTRQIPSAKVDGDEQLVTTNKRLRDTNLINPGANLSGTTITTVEKEERSDLVSQEVTSTRQFLNKSAFSKVIPNPLPPQLQILREITETSNVVGGTAVVPTRQAGELERTEQQLTRLLKRVSTKTLGTGALPVIMTGKELTTEYGGLILNTEKKLHLVGDPSLDIPTAWLTEPGRIRAKVEQFGDFGIREVASAATTFVPLIGGDVDPQAHVVLPYTQRVVPAGAVATIGNGTYTEIKPLDSARSLSTVRTIDVTALLARYWLMVDTTNVDLPNQLVLVRTVNGTTGSSAGYYTQTGSYTIAGHGSEGVHLQGDAHGSAVAMLDLQYEIQQFQGNNIATNRYLFFVNGNAGPGVILARLRQLVTAEAGVNFWPKFRPRSAAISITGRRGTGKVLADIHHRDSVVSDFEGNIRHQGAVRSRGSGASFDNEVTIKTITLPATVHPALNITGPTSATVGFAASSQIGNNIQNVNIAVAGNVTTSIFPTTIPATPGANSVPTTGRFITKMRSEQWNYGLTKVEVEVVDATSW